MPSLGSKKEFQKRDLNFFADLTAAAAKMTRVIGYFVFIGIIVVAAIVAVIVYCAIRNAITQAAINDVQATLDSEEYKNIESRATELKKELDDYNNYFFVLSQMREQVDQTHEAPVSLPDTLKDCIPSDTYIENYAIDQTTLTFDGYTFSYYSALNLVNMLNNSDVFSIPVELKIERVEPSTVGTYESFLKNGINNYYKFEVSGTLVKDVYVSVSRYLAEGESYTSLGGVESTSYAAGSSYSVEGISEYTQMGVTYTLSQISINGTKISGDEFNSLVEANAISGLATGDIKIDLYYKQAETQPAE